MKIWIPPPNLFGLTRICPSGTYFGDLWKFDPSTNIWTNLSSVPNAPSKRTWPGFAGAYGQLFVYGGKDVGKCLICSSFPSLMSLIKVIYGLVNLL